MQTPSAHIATQGRVVSNSGATPIATSQLQLSARPTAITKTPRTIRPRLPSRDFKLPSLYPVAVPIPLLGNAKFPRGTILDESGSVMTVVSF